MILALKTFLNRLSFAKGCNTVLPILLMALYSLGSVFVLVSTFTKTFIVSRILYMARDTTQTYKQASHNILKAVTRIKSAFVLSFYYFCGYRFNRYPLR